VMLTSGGDPLQLTSDEGSKYLDSFSADGTQIYYQRELGAGEEIWPCRPWVELPGAFCKVTTSDPLPTARACSTSIHTRMTSFNRQLMAWAGRLFWGRRSLALTCSDNLCFPTVATYCSLHQGQSPQGTVRLYRWNIATRKATNIGELSGSPRSVNWGDPGKMLLSIAK